MIDDIEVLRYTAFADHPAGGNRAGVVVETPSLDDAAMLAVAASVGYSETAFLTPMHDAGTYRVRYFSPAVEVPFCGHATIASAVALFERGSSSALTFQTQSGDIGVTVSNAGGRPVATLTSVHPRIDVPSDESLAGTLQSLGWSTEELDTRMPPRVAFAGAHHLILGIRSRALLAAMSYDFDQLRAVMEIAGWITVQLVWREDVGVFHVRVPFPVGGVVEDAATGAGAAAFGAYLRALHLIAPPCEFTIRQGEDMGRPSRLLVGVDVGHGGIRVSGTATLLPPAFW